MNKAIVIFLSHGSRWDSNRPVREQDYWDDHARFMDDLFDSGKVILAGPFADDSGTMVIVSFDSIDRARAIFQEDPWAKQDVLHATEFKEWNIFLDGRDRELSKPISA